jgi:methyl-accepting chemotaxis protein
MLLHQWTGGTAEVSKGIALAEKAGEMLRGIVGNAESVSEMVTQIASASEQQARSSEEISRNIEGISAVTSENANAVQQIARTAEDLNTMTENLQAILEKFTLERAGTLHVHQSNNGSRRSVPAERRSATVVRNRELSDAS